VKHITTVTCDDDQMIARTGVSTGVGTTAGVIAVMMKRQNQMLRPRSEYLSTNAQEGKCAHQVKAQFGPDRHTPQLLQLPIVPKV
jgi:hypothetical protein